MRVIVTWGDYHTLSMTRCQFDTSAVSVTLPARLDDSKVRVRSDNHG